MVHAIFRRNGNRPGSVARRRGAWRRLGLLLGCVASVGFVPFPVMAADGAGVRELGRLVRELVEANPAVQAARAGVDAAEAAGRAAERPLYNPELELEAERGEAASGSVGIQQSVDWTDKRSARAAVAAGELEARRFELADRRRAVAGELLRALADVQTAEALHELARRRTALMQRFLTLAEKRRRAGDLSLSELELARLAHTQARLNEADAAAALVEARQALAAVSGGGRDWPALPEALPAPPAEDLDALLQRLPAIRAQQARVRAAASLVELRRRERRPDPTFGLRGGVEGPEPLVGLSFSVPLYVRNDFRAEVEQAHAERIRAERELAERMRRARAALASARERYRLAREAWRLWTESGVPSIEKQVRLLDRVWRAGEIGTTDYLVQVDQTLATRADALTARGRMWRSWFDWLEASDGFARWFGWETAP